MIAALLEASVLMGVVLMLYPLKLFILFIKEKTHVLQKNCNFWNIVYSNMNRFLEGLRLQTNANELDIELFWGLKHTILVIYEIFEYIRT